jgi:hypothetical protein
MSKSQRASFRIPADEYRSLPFPQSLSKTGNRARVGSCFVRVEDLPPELESWLEVNPRTPKKNKKARLVGHVAKAMIRTVLEEPERFALKNQGIYLLVDRVEFTRGEGGQGVVALELSDQERHGIVNGGHSFLAIQEALSNREEDGLSGAYVRLHVLEGIDGDEIIELAEGLNRSMQVDDPSLENLSGKFDQIKNVLKGQQGADQIAYHQGDHGDLEITQVLGMMALFDLERYPDRKKHPNDIFASPKRVLQHFTEDAEEGALVFGRIVPRLPEILVLSDEIQKKSVVRVGRLKVKDTKSGNRVRSEKNMGRPAHFSGGIIDGLFPLGWLFPMLAAFRANAKADAWAKGKLEWLVNPLDLLESVVEEMADVIKQEHADNLLKPAEVGRKEAAYRLCYGIVTMELAQRGLLNSN